MVPLTLEKLLFCVKSRNANEVTRISNVSCSSIWAGIHEASINLNYILQLKKYSVHKIYSRLIHK